MGSSGSALGRAHAILLHIAQGGESATLRDIATELGIPQSTGHRILGQLVEEELVVALPSGQFRLGWKALQLARRIWNATSDQDFALPLMQDLSHTTGETVTLNKYLPHEGFCVCVAVAETAHPLSYALEVGDTRYLNMGAGGKAILAGLSDEEARAVIARTGLPSATGETVTELARLHEDLAIIRTQGYAVSRGESVPGAIGYAVPIFCRGRQVFGSMAVTAPQMRFLPEWEPGWIAALVEKADTLSELLGGDPEVIAGFYPRISEDAATL